MLSLVGSPVVHAEASTAAFQIALPAGAAEGDYLWLVWAAGWNSSLNWVEPALAISATGVITGMNVNISGPDGSDNWCCVGSCQVSLTGDDIVAGTYGLQAANLTAFDDSPGTYIGDIFAVAFCWSGGLEDGGGQLFGSLNDYGDVPTWDKAGAGMAFGYTFYNAAGHDPTSDLDDFTFARGSDTRQVVSAGTFTYPNTGIPTYATTEGAGYNTVTAIGFWQGLTEAAVISVDTPATISLAGASPDLTPPVPLPVDVPANLTLAGGSPDLVPIQGILIDTPVSVALTPGTPSLLFSVLPLSIDTPASLTLAGGTAELLVEGPPVSMAIDTPVNFVLAGDVPALTPEGGAAATLVIGTPVSVALAGGVPDLIVPAAPATLTIDTPANLAVAGATPVLGVVDYVGPMTAELDLTGQLRFYQTLPANAVSALGAIGFGVDLHASTLIEAPNFVDYNPGDLQLRLMQGVFVDLPTPVIVEGKPLLPKYVARFDPVITLIEGQANLPPDHIHSIPDPDPIWNFATSGWYIQPPDAGVGDARWTVNDLPDPAPFAGGYYWLGDPSSADGTSGIAAGCRQWSPSPGTPAAPSWRSVYPYKPSVRAHVNYGPGGNILTKTRGVRYNLQFIEHMWLDFGGVINAPITWIVVGIIMDFPTSAYQHNILDVGRAPEAGGAPHLNENQLARDYGLNENIQGGARPAIYAGLNQQVQLGDWNGSQALNNPFDAASRPKMFFGVWDGANSIGGTYSTAGKHFLRGGMPATLTRYVLMGRRGGILSRNYASHLVTFEIRFWRSALVEQQLDAQYGQLSSTWNFGAYS